MLYILTKFIYLKPILSYRAVRAPSYNPVSSLRCISIDFHRISSLWHLEFLQQQTQICAYEKEILRSVSVGYVKFIFSPIFFGNQDLQMGRLSVLIRVLVLFKTRLLRERFGSASLILRLFPEAVPKKQRGKQ